MKNYFRAMDAYNEADQTIAAVTGEIALPAWAWACGRGP